ncbi:MAG: XrtA/PEP-CTERM system TPR-repeat protein PrsT [Candidatus Competibacteraceae bacterium]
MLPPKLTEAEYLKIGTDEFAANRLPAAVTALQQVLDLNAANVPARLLLARAYLGMSEGNHAEEGLKPLLDRAPPSSYIVYLGQAWLQQGKYEQILEQLRPQPGLDNQSLAQVLALRGQAYLARGNLEAAARELDTALENAPDNPMITLSLLRLRLMQQQLPEATELVHRILTEAPDDPDAWSLQGELALRQGQLQAAEEAYSKAIKYRYNADTGDLLNRAMVRVYLGNYPAAEEDITVVRKRLRDHAGILFVTGLMHFFQGKYADAWNRLELAAQVDPKYLPTYYYLGLCNYALGQWKLGQQNLNDYYRKQPKAKAVGLLLAGGQILQDDNLGAEMTLQSILKQDPTEPRALELLGYDFLAQDKNSLGVTQLQQRIKLPPDTALLRARLGLAQWVLGQEEQAGLQFDRAAQLSPEQEPIKEQIELLRILCRLQMSDYANAMRLILEWHERQPDHPLPEVLQGILDAKRNQRTEALTTFMHALQLQPGNFAATLQTVRLLDAGLRTEQARTLLQAALQNQPDNAVFLLELAAMEYERENIPEVHRLLERVLTLRPDLLLVRVKLADLLLQAQRAQEAVKILQQAPITLTDQTALQELLGEAQLATGDVFNATQTLRTLAWSKPSALSGYLLAAALAQQGETAASQRELDKALNLDPTFKPAQVARARQLLAARETAEARRQLEVVRRGMPDNINVLSLQGDLAMADNQFQQAVDIFGKLQQLYPASSHWVVKLAQAQWNAGEPEAAVATYRHWLTEHPDDSRIQRELADIYLKTGQNAAAGALYERLQQPPDQDALLLNLAWSLRQSDPAKAQTYAERALRRQPNSLLAKGTLALIQLAAGKKDRAVPLLKEVLGDVSLDLGTQFQLVQALAQAGERQTARRYLQRILEDPRIFPERAQAETLMGEISRLQ